MSQSLIVDAVLSLVPGWYRCGGGKQPFELRIGKQAITFYTTRRLTPDMLDLKKYAENHSKILEEYATRFPAPIAVDLIQEVLASQWLHMRCPKINWRKLLAYSRELSERTYENSTIIKNIVVTINENGNFDISETKHAKIFDVLSSSPQCFIKVDKELRFVDYSEISWEIVKDTSDYKFHPEFLHPFYCILKDGEYSIHHTSRRDLIVMGCGGVIATKRKNRWKIYDSANLKNSLTDILCDEYRIGCNMYEILMDLSFRRHGALLIFDPGNKLSDQVVNTHAWIASGASETGSAHGILRDRVRQIEPDAWGKTSRRDKRLFLELASTDGALIFSTSRVAAFGAMIKTHSDAKGQYGARTTAALSAYLYGAYPMKISADGDIRILFNSEDEAGNKYPAELAFA